MARKVVEAVVCDACSVKGKERTGVIELAIGSASYDLCQEHGDKFAAYFEDLFGSVATVAA
ncbi:hypothetical protein [Streptomyces vinaceus]|uniref:hypothetical protein n=1 Tax=Streptomyces vinaceus TaxID=1960 RepID=UPI0036CBABDB